MVTQKFCIALLLTCLSTACLAQQPSIFLADPTIFSDQGKYFLYGTGHPDGFPVYESNNLKTWTPVPHRLALTRGDAFGTQGFWAPQIFLYKGVYYMAYTANEQVAIAKSASPAGPFTQSRYSFVSMVAGAINTYSFAHSTCPERVVPLSIYSLLSGISSTL
ncbi:family 43 glycosylhydrolase [[Flexibacter] sp. ATCC 35208]|uniref:family 43 glycosylhydrolase n=1 Tax=[Flexibacter] sp. ATCC 35208 TaxID=1936242 RepID=UPI0009CFF6A0|nr:family 43 glycosylhydrolase [[Flexibacter] sp. ATCC 35208]OMP76753.1 hypothetical protein BW716_23450 [[Flexibacter] sp. ATCC 35208]